MAKGKLKKALKRKRGINWHLIYENRGKWDKRMVEGHRLHEQENEVK